MFAPFRIVGRVSPSVTMEGKKIEGIMKLLQMADPVRYARMTTEERRATFLLEGMFQPGVIDLAYVDLDRTVIGSAVPLAGAPLTLEASPELRADYFLERREVGVLNVGGPGTVTVDGVAFGSANSIASILGVAPRKSSSPARTPTLRPASTCSAIRRTRSIPPRW